MRRVRCAFSSAFLAIALLPALPGISDAVAAEEEEPPAGGRSTLRVGPLPADFILEGGMSGPAWSTATDSIANLTMIEPEVGSTPEARTVIKVLADRDEIVVGARCYDPEPRRIVSVSMARDAVLDEEDHILLVFDTFLDGRSGYVFAVNPSGSRFDGLVNAEGDEANSDWDTIWDATTSRDSEGWTAVIRIPVKSLGFKRDLTTWGFNVQRRVQALQETSRWSGAKRDFEVFQTSRSGLLTGLPAFELGLGMSIRPAVVGRVTRPAREAGTDTNGDLILDATQALGSNLLSSLTVNTDFAETEVDARQINLTRFPIFFPEKRTFFLAGADIFEFGLGLDEETIVPFFSRRIGLLGLSEDDQAAIPINAGGKISGRMGATNLGALIVGTRRVNNLTLPEEDLTLTVPQTTMGSVRVRQNVFEESSLGVIANFGDQLGRSGSWATGADFTYRTSSFRDEKNLALGVWGLLNDREDLRGEKAAYGFRAEYPNDLVDINVGSTRIGDGFDPSLSFVRRNDVHIWDFTATFVPRPRWPFVRQLTQELSFALFNRRNNDTWSSYSLSARPFDLLLESGDSFELAIEPEGDRPPEGSAIVGDVNLSAGSYEWTRYVVGARSAAKRRVSARVLWESGKFYNGDLNTVEGGLTVRPSAFLTLELTGERNTGTVTGLVETATGETLSEEDFKEELVGIRLQLNVSPDLQVGSVTQYDTETRALGSNNRLRWTFDPHGDLFVVYNHNLERTVEDRWRFVSKQMPVKIQYSWRF